ncbi:hypothetical protein ACA910_001352 [Epithemia clementina (nom. ined.)]
MDHSDTRRVRRRRAPEEEATTRDGAGLTYSQLADILPQSTAPELHIPGVDLVAAFDPTDLKILDATGARINLSLLPPIEIINSDETKAYSFVKKVSTLKHHYENGQWWGEIWSCVQYTKVKGCRGTYMAPATDKYVAIKKLRKRVVDAYLKKGTGTTITPTDLRVIDREYISQAISIIGRENPYREMSRMDEFGDNRFVLRQIEFLQDDDFLYIVMPHACERGSLDHAIFGRQYPMTPTEAQDLFLKILHILLYLEQKKIHHRDLSPDNFIFLTSDHLVVIDLAMSVKMPVDEHTGQRTLIKAIGRFGTPPFMASEVHHDFQLFDGVSVDLWSAVLILYSMLTKKLLYRQPDPNTDIAYRYFVVAGALTQDPVNERIMDVLCEVFQHSNHLETQNTLIDLAAANRALTPDSREIFHHMLRCNPRHRWTLAQVLNSRFCTQPQH